MPAMADEKLKVLFATSEVAPLIKTGGLADVSAALPAALMGRKTFARPASSRRTSSV